MSKNKLGKKLTVLLCISKICQAADATVAQNALTPCQSLKIRSVGEISECMCNLSRELLPPSSILSLTVVCK